MLNPADPEKARRIAPLFRLAFRPFFLGGALFSVLALALWGVFWVIFFGGDLDKILDIALGGFVLFALCAAVGIGWNRIKPRSKAR